jgi:glucokinase
MADGASHPPGLVGDIGGTNARFALAIPSDGRPDLTEFRAYRCADHACVDEALEAYFAELEGPRPRTAVIAVAGPVVDGAIAFTNLGWRMTERDLAESLGFDRITLINDYAALALAAPVLSEADTRRIGPPVSVHAKSTLAILGAGTGFGASALVRDGAREAVLTTEGGHVAFAPTGALEVEIWRILSHRFGRVSVERILSGPGLMNLYGALVEIEGRGHPCITPDEVTRRADDGEALALRAVNIFCEIRGSVAGDFALAYGAQGGVFVAGGVAPHFLSHLERSGFRDRFEAKGRFESYLAAIPTRVVTHPQAALLGAGRALLR